MDFLAASFRVVISTPDGRGCPCSHSSALKATSSHSSFCEPHTVSRNTSAKMVAQTSPMLPLHGTGQELSIFFLARTVAKVPLNCQLPLACWREIRTVCLSDVVFGFSLTESVTSIASSLPRHSTPSPSLDLDLDLDLLFFLFYASSSSSHLHHLLYPHLSNCVCLLALPLLQ